MDIRILSESPATRVEIVGLQCPSVAALRELLVEADSRIVRGDTIVVPARLWRACDEATRDAMLRLCISYGVKHRVEPFAVGSPWRERGGA